jgi:hypothetical protein
MTPHVSDEYCHLQSCKLPASFAGIEIVEPS